MDDDADNPDRNGRLRQRLSSTARCPSQPMAVATALYRGEHPIRRAWLFDGDEMYANADQPVRHPLARVVSELSARITPARYRPPVESITDVARLVQSKEAKLDLRSPIKAISKQMLGRRDLEQALAVNPPVYSHVEALPMEMNEMIITISME